jgi:hypothetical protein
MNKRLLIAFAALLGSVSLHATERILAASNRSNSIEEFSTSGTGFAPSLPPARMPGRTGPKSNEGRHLRDHHLGVGTLRGAAHE